MTVYITLSHLKFNSNIKFLYNNFISYIIDISIIKEMIDICLYYFILENNDNRWCAREMTGHLLLLRVPFLVLFPRKVGLVIMILV